MDIVPVDMADRRQHFGDIWHLYVISGPARQHWGHAWPPRHRPRVPGRIHSISLALLTLKLGRAEAPSSGSLRRARARSTLHRHPPKLSYSSTVLCSPTSTLKLAMKPSGEPPFSPFPKIGLPEQFSPASPMLSSSEPLFFFFGLSLWVA